MRHPRRLEVRVGVAANTQREPDPVLDGIEIEGLANPGLAGRRAADGKNTRGRLALLVGGDRRLSVIDFHAPLPNAGFPAPTRDSAVLPWRQLYPGNIDRATTGRS